MTDPSATPHTPTPPPTSNPGGRFFDWVRSLGVVRQNEWLGGVAGGLAARVGIDPIIVRGIFVVAGLIGAPALLVYAVCWVLLPDASGRIHFQNLMRGRFDPPMIVAMILAALTLLPFVPWFGRLVFWPFDQEYQYGFQAFLTTMLFLGLAALIVIAIVQVSKARKREHAEAGSTPEFTPTTAPSTAAPSSLSAPADVSPPATTTEPAEPVRPTDADDPDGERLAAWRQQHEDWLAQHGQWREQQRHADAAARAQSQRERAEKAAAFARESAAARAVRRTANRRTPWWFLLATVGGAIVTAALVLLASSSSGLLLAGPVAIWSAAIVGGVAMLIAGIAKFRSGFIAFLTSIAVIAAVPLTATAVSIDRIAAVAHENTGDDYVSAPDSVRFGDTGMADYDGQAEIRILQLAGSTWLSPNTALGGTTILTKGVGGTSIEVGPDEVINLRATLAPGARVYVHRGLQDGGADIVSLAPRVTDKDGITYWETTLRGQGPADKLKPAVELNIAQLSDVNVYINFPYDESRNSTDSGNDSEGTSE